MDCEFVKKIAGQIVSRFGTSDVLAIAEKSGVKIVYQKWFPVTIGEFNGKKRTICVNLNAAETVEKIVAHELGHFFAESFNFDKQKEEEFAHLFAECMMEKK